MAPIDSMAMTTVDNSEYKAAQAKLQAATAAMELGVKIRDAQRKIMVRMDTDLSGRTQRLAKRIDPFGDVAHQHRAAGVHDVDAGGAVALHESRLDGERMRGGHVAHHQEADSIHAEFCCGR